mgnify:CR=1 FL=1
MEQNHYILVGSITNAMRGRRLLEAEGIRAYMHRDTKASEGDGCGFSLLVTEQVERAVRILKERGVRVIRIRDAI